MKFICKWLSLLLTCFYVSCISASVFFNPEVGIKQYYSSIEPKDRQDAALYIGMGWYITGSNYTALLGVTTGSTKRENGVVKCYVYCGEYPININFSNSLDFLVGKIFPYNQYYVHLQGGINLSTIKIDDINEKIDPEYKIMPKVKISLGKQIYKHIYINLNYHHVFSFEKLSINSTPPYNFKGYPSHGIVSIGVNYFI